MKLPPIPAPVAGQLRAEAEGMAGAYADALRTYCPADSVIGVYAKGSAFRPWDSVIDYVPEVSDVDVHARLAPLAVARLGEPRAAMELAEEALTRFRRAFPDALHTPRPQFVVLDELERTPGYLASPANCVRTLFGPEYEAGTPADYARSRVADAERFAADARHVAGELAGRLIDRPGRLVWNVVSTLAWRVAPAAPRLLTLLGTNPYEAWSWNRTHLVEELLRQGCDAVAQAYADFYLAGWDGFTSRFEDASAGRRAVLATERLFAEGSKVLEVRGMKCRQGEV